MRSYIYNLGLKAFAIITRDKEVFTEGTTTGGDCTLGESFGVCCPTSFPGSLLFAPQEAREGRPWLGLVTCLLEKNYTQGGVLHLLVFVKIYCPLQKEASALLRAAHAKLIQLAMFFSKSSFCELL